MRRIVCFAVIALAASNAHAFGEDVCYPTGGGPMVNCLVIPEACLPVGTDTQACRVAAIAAAVQSGVDTDAGRSLVHTDATYVIAQAVGFTAEDAYWIAAYDEAIDLGSFTLRNATGIAVDDSRNTVDLDGLTRSNLTTGGVLYHFVSPMSASTDGLRPDVDDEASEVLLAHLRRWALAATDLSCTGGLTVLGSNGDYALGDSCFERFDEPTDIDCSLAAVSDAAVSFTVSTGVQTVAPSVPADDFDLYVGEEHAASARIGVYLHVLGDRISHHVCTDGSPLQGPSPAGNFTVAMTGDDCTQGVHLLRHMWETGVDFTAVGAVNQTTVNALAAVYDALFEFAQARGLSSTASRDQVLEGLTAALQVTDAQARVDAIAGVACAAGLTPFPETITCPQPSAETPSEPEPPVPTDTEVPQDEPQPASDDGCAAAPASIFALLALLPRVKPWRASMFAYGRRNPDARKAPSP